jgi:pyruvate dehydrogenase E1 component alpha subunit
MSAKQQATDRVAACFFGEGALGQGVLYEVMNMASLWKLPVIYVCENNLYNEYTHYRETTAGQVTARAESFGIPAETVDGQDVLAVRTAASRAVERARGGEGPTFLECSTYRFFGHHVGDVDRSYYRSKQEEEEWRSTRDPLQLLGNWMRERGYADEDDLKGVDERVAAEVEEGERFALGAPYPDASEVDRHIYP